MRDIPLYFSAFVVLGGVIVLMSSQPAPLTCPQMATVVEYLPQQEVRALPPPSTLPSFDDMPLEAPEPVAVAAPKKEPVVEEATVEEDPAPRRRGYRHWRRRHR